MGEKHGCWILPTEHLFHACKVLLHALNLWYGTNGFTSPPKSCYGFLSPLKIHRPQLGLNLWTLGPVASTLPLDHRGRQSVAVGIYWGGGLPVKFIIHITCMRYVWKSNFINYYIISIEDHWYISLFSVMSCQLKFHKGVTFVVYGNRGFMPLYYRAAGLTLTPGLVI
jgi:hypothetical protein